ncbi:MAG: TIGR03619 family F420-dependent LLM class oxidoreductase [Nitrososphaeria archaeon]|nr:TIGR03619 family F420-dependent LLM class oxidoreductase [Nitrososphaeria archaeon]NIN53365.1 TIGR03619 family F420-dependent LLM class oxidoreductase [Nitrososphaeria archaeon]NIQ33831.1 TIGR03619 family F420-dependent LLM class oxidoreductase [Nitrososphaeria archaeon]
MKFGIRLPHVGMYASVESILQAARDAEDLGYDSVWVHDHIALNPEWERKVFIMGRIEEVEAHTGDPDFYESITTLSYVAGATEHIKLGVSAIVLPLRNPLILAKQCATLHEISGRRLILCTCIGYLEGAFRIFNVSFKRRASIMEEYLQVLKEIFSPSPSSSFDGEYISFRDAQFHPKPKDLPIWICGQSSQALRRVASLGDGWHPFYLTPDEYGEKLNLLKEQLRRHGRKESDIILSHQSFMCLKDTDAEARDISALTLKKNYGSIENGERKHLIGSPSRIVERLEEYTNMGVNYYQLLFICRGVKEMLEMMRLFSKEVMPSFR